VSPLDRKSATEQESSKTRRLTIRLPLDVVRFLERQELNKKRDGWNITKEITSCVRAKMFAMGYGPR